MAEAERAIRGGCLCGAVRYACRGRPLAVAYCHCASCRHHSGAPAVVWISFLSEQVRYEKGAPKVYASSPGVGRAFCGDCGTPLTWQGRSRGSPGQQLTEFYIGTLDDPAAQQPDRHWFIAERLPWFEILDALPRYEALDGPGVAPLHLGPRSA